MNCAIFDLDQTIVDSSSIESDRKARNWNLVYSKLHQLKSYSNIDKVIETLRFNDYKIGIVSNSPKLYCTKLLDTMQIKVDYIVGYHCTILKKPMPDPILFCISQLGNKFEKIFGVGDNENDIISYQNANINSIGCLWGNNDNRRLISSNPDFLISDPLKIIEIAFQDAKI